MTGKKFKYVITGSLTAFNKEKNKGKIFENNCAQKK